MQTDVRGLFGALSVVVTKHSFSQQQIYFVGRRVSSRVHEFVFFEIFLQAVERRFEELHGVDELQVTDHEADIMLHVCGYAVHLLPCACCFLVTMQHEVAVVSSHIIKY